KWPNDVMVNRRKVAGVLAEARDGIVVLGIGLNVNQTREQLPGDARVPPASLRTVDGVERDRAPLLADVLARLERAYDAWTAGGLDAVFDGIGSRDFLRGRRVSVNGGEGGADGLYRGGRLARGGRDEQADRQHRPQVALDRTGCPGEATRPEGAGDAAERERTEEKPCVRGGAEPRCLRGYGDLDEAERGPERDRDPEHEPQVS